MKVTLVLLVLGCALVGTNGRPQGGTCPNGDPWFENANSVDENGCTVGYCEKVCPTGAFTNDNRSVTFRGNQGPQGTGSNGNAGPISADTGLAIDPAAETYKKQIQAYIEWAERQNKPAQQE